MQLPKQELRNSRWFHLVKPEELEGLEEFAAWLEALLHNPCSIWDEDGESTVLEIKRLVERMHGLRIEIYPNEHPPPHFHVKSPSVNASFSIAECELLSGDASPGDIRKIKHWHRFSKPLLVSHWDDTRPTQCSVGKFREP